MGGFASEWRWGCRFWSSALLREPSPQLRCGGGWGSERRGYRKVVRGVAVGSAGMVDPGIDGLEMRAG